MNRVLVTGATGFVGSALCDLLARRGYEVRAAVRTPGNLAPHVAESVVVGDIGAATDWKAALDGVSFIIHAAARAHVVGDSESNSTLYTATNADGTRCLADAAALAGVRRFIYLSSIKVNGEETEGRAYTADDIPHPQGIYGSSKWAGEKSLLQIAAASRMQAVVVRSPIVYGPGVRANFLRLLSWVDKERPIPLGAVHNSRSLVSVWNLCDLLVDVLSNPPAAGRTWMVSDAEDLSTPELIRRIGKIMKRRVWLIPVPMSLLQIGGKVTGRAADVARLCGSLTVDVTQTRAVLGWSAPFTVDEALARTVEWYLSKGSASAH